MLTKLVMLWCSLAVVIADLVLTVSDFHQRVWEPTIKSLGNPELTGPAAIYFIVIAYGPVLFTLAASVIMLEIIERLCALGGDKPHEDEGMLTGTP